MKVYLVGGAVRDEALKLPVHERDWVVVGGTPNDLLAQGYKQVGRDFPVFLHPLTHEEYALARTERKQGKGYHGFTCEFNPHVTLEDDLMRRDLTINAMAKDEQGQLIDPYDGMRDLHAKYLRHVSPAFAEDPVRVLRVARFAARYRHLGFKVAEDTRELMYAMVNQGELDYLVTERVWQEWQRALAGEHPETFLEILRGCGALRVILPELDRLFGIPNHTCVARFIDTGMAMLAHLTHAACCSRDPMIRFSVLVLELGKLGTPIGNWPIHTDYNILGLDFVDAFCTRLRVPRDYRDLACLSAQFHLAIRQGAALGSAGIVQVLEKTDAFRRPARFHALLQVCRAWEDAKHQALCAMNMARWQQLLALCQAIDVQQLSQQHQGEAIKMALQAHRVARVEWQLNQWACHEK